MSFLLIDDDFIFRTMAIKQIELFGVSTETKESYTQLLNEVSKKQLETLENLNDVIQIKESHSLDFTPLDIKAEVNSVLQILRPEIEASLIQIKK